MKAFFKKRFALTDQGAADLVKSSFATFVTYFVTMFPAMLLMLFFDKTLLFNERSNEIYLVVSAGILLLTYVVLSVEYSLLYDATYKESENLRIDLARNISDLPLSYFSKHDLTDLAQTIMLDVAALEHALSHAIARAIGFFGFFIVISAMLLIGNVKLGLCVVAPIVVFLALLLISKKVQTKGFDKYYENAEKTPTVFKRLLSSNGNTEFRNERRGQGKLYKEIEEGKIQFRSEIPSVVVTSLAGYALSCAHLDDYRRNGPAFKGETNILYFLGYLLAGIKIKEAADGALLQYCGDLFYRLCC